MAGQDTGCRGKAWLGGAALGLLVAAFLLLVSHQSFLAALFLGLMACLLFGGFLVWAFCSGSDIAQAPARVAAMPTPASAPAAPAPVQADAPKAAAPAPSANATASVAGSVKPAATTAGAAPDSAKPTGLASGAPATKAAATEAPAAVASGGAAVSAAPAQGIADIPAAKAEAKPAAKKAAVKKPAAQKAPAAKKAAAKPAAKAAEPKAKATPKAPSDADVAAAGEGKKPRGLKAPRKAGADDLKVIEGIGPKLEDVLNGWGVFHYDQIAKWGAAEVAFANANVPRFKGRCSRDKWVSQAIIICEEGMDVFLEKAKTNDY